MDDSRAAAITFDISMDDPAGVNNTQLVMMIFELDRSTEAPCHKIGK